MNNIDARGATIQHPLVHLNGTSAQALFDAYREAGTALHAALEALSASYPNQRDYYPLGDAAWSRAKSEHEARMAAVRSAYLDMAALCENLAELL